MSFGSSRTPRPFATRITATVKWYNSTKGFGFVTPDDGSPDAFLHASAFEMLGHDSLPDGATVIVDLAQGMKGPQVSTVHSVDLSTATASSRGQRHGGFRDGPQGGFGGRDRDADAGPTEEIDGTVKWFNPAKGFGFIASDAGGKDVFVHMTALQRSGLTSLSDGVRVRAEVRQGQKGPEAVRLDLE
jgi:CspA family cold shock protein